MQAGRQYSKAEKEGTKHKPEKEEMLRKNRNLKQAKSPQTS